MPKYFNCDRCGMIVVDQLKHSEWHRSVQNAAIAATILLIREGL